MAAAKTWKSNLILVHYQHMYLWGDNYNMASAGHSHYYRQVHCCLSHYWSYRQLSIMVFTIFLFVIKWVCYNPYIPTQSPEEDKRWPYAITRLTAHFMCGRMSDLVVCSLGTPAFSSISQSMCQKGWLYSRCPWYWMSLLGPGVVPMLRDCTQVHYLCCVFSASMQGFPCHKCFSLNTGPVTTSTFNP